MRLIELRLKNLNSLKGEWHIDFSDKAFVNEGIFAITGQTGAGKTTILDAICLALYGETPRINSISKSNNEVMTRQTGECFAEVVIELNGAQYRCRWGQRRAYGKPDGNLQDATHELSRVNLDDADKGDEILEEKLSRTKQKIIELTSMDFQQFTRSILLAQGSFSAFLKAKADERADILEKITGTQIYADISKNVHEKYRTQKEELERMQAVSDSLSLLDEQTETEYRKNIESLNTELASKKTKQNNLETQIKWLDDVADLKHKLSQYTEEASNAEQAKLDFKSDAERLDKANKALEISNTFNQLVTYRKQLDNVNAERQQGKKDFAEAEGQLIQNKIGLDHAISAEQTSTGQYEKAQPVIGEIRGLDGQILQFQQRLDDQLTRRDSLTSHIDELNATLIASKNEQTQLQTKLDTATDYLSTHSHHESLARDIESFHQLGLQVKSLLSNTADKASHRQQALDNLEQLTQKLEVIKSSQLQADNEVESKKREVESLKQEHRNLLQGQTLQSLRHQQNDIDHSSKQLSDMRAQFGQISELTSQAQTTTRLLPDSQANINKLQQRIESDEQTLAKLNTEFEDKKTNVELLQQIAKLEDFIHLLQDDEPCPLCGSLEHPYSGNHPLLESKSQEDSAKPSPIAELKNRLSELSIEIKTIEKVISDDKISLATSKNALNGHQKQLAEKLAQTSKLVVENRSQIANFEQYLNEVSPALLASFDKFSLVTQLNNSQKVLTSFFDTLASNKPDFNKPDFNEPVNDVSSEVLEKVKETSDDLILLLQEVMQDLASQKKSLNALLDDNDTFMREISQSETALKSLQDNAQSTLQEINRIETDIKLGKQQVASDDSYIDNNFTEIERLVQSIRELASQYESDDNKEWTTLDTTLNQLNDSMTDKQALTTLEPETYIEPLREYCRGIKQLQKDYDQQRKLSQSLSSEISNSATKVKGLENQLEQLQGERDSLSTAIDDLQTNLTTLQDNRQQLYRKMHSELNIQISNFDDSNKDAHIDIDAIDKRLRLAVDNVRQKLSEVRERYNNNQQRIEQLKQHGLKLDKEIAETNDKLVQQQAVFDELLTDNNFADESQFKDAMLARETREALAVQNQQIESDLKISQRRLEDTKQQLEDKLANPLVEGDKADKTMLTNELSAIELEISELNKHIGALEQQLKTNANNRTEHLTQLQAINKHKDILRVWGDLHKLIGSEKGKKYRTFAQGLTFQIMVSNANIQLEKMSDRYLLTRDEDSPLELNVIDNYQGGEVRSTKNLSGGEGFIISLALALGLSKMASQSISVDSLFLDEGFGTLDEDSLDIALDTLTNLQAEGKLIGVISHVQSLKERILTQIKVEKISGGHSQISGTGCTRIS